MATIVKVEGKKGSTYKAVVRMKGYPTQTASFTSKKKAEFWAGDTESAIRDGRHFKTVEAKKHTLKDLIDKYTKSDGYLKLAGKEDRGTQLEWWKSELGCYSLADISGPMITECKTKLSTVPYTTDKAGNIKLRSEATVNRYLAALSHMYSYAVTDLGWCDDNPLAKVHKMKEPRGRTRYLSEDERNRLLAACKTTKNKHLYLIVLLALSTGARQGEIMGLEWRDVELDPQRKRVVLRDTKNGETRAVPLVDRAYELLKEHSKVRRIDTPLVFPGASKSGKDAKPLIIREAWESAVHKAGLENFHFHDLRHTCASYLAMNGATLAEIAEVLGHKTLSMVQRYSHLSEQHVKGVLSKMNDSFLAGVA